MKKFLLGAVAALFVAGGVWASTQTPQQFLPGNRLIDGQQLNNALANPLYSTLDNVVASTTHTQVGGTPISTTSTLVRVTTVASSGDAITLPPAYPGDEFKIFNSGANPMQVYATGSDTINATAGSTGISQTNGKGNLYFCVTQGSWQTIIGN
jgi:hypothetical protein